MISNRGECFNVKIFVMCFPSKKQQFLVLKIGASGSFRKGVLSQNILSQKKTYAGEGIWEKVSRGGGGKGEIGP